MVSNLEILNSWFPTLPYSEVLANIVPQDYVKAQFLAYCKFGANLPHSTLKLVLQVCALSWNRINTWSRSRNPHIALIVAAIGMMEP